MFDKVAGGYVQEDTATQLMPGNRQLSLTIMLTVISDAKFFYLGS
jgi:hypothetical protein